MAAFFARVDGFSQMLSADSKEQYVDFLTQTSVLRNHIEICESWPESNPTHKQFLALKSKLDLLEPGAVTQISAEDLDKSLAELTAIETAIESDNRCINAISGTWQDFLKYLADHEVAQEAKDTPEEQLVDDNPKEQDYLKTDLGPATAFSDDKRDEKQIDITAYHLMMEFENDDLMVTFFNQKHVLIQVIFPRILIDKIKSFTNNEEISLKYVISDTMLRQYGPYEFFYEFHRFNYGKVCVDLGFEVYFKFNKDHFVELYSSPLLITISEQALAFFMENLAKVDFVNKKIAGQSSDSWKFDKGIFSKLPRPSVASKFAETTSNWQPGFHSPLPTQQEQPPTDLQSTITVTAPHPN